MLFSLSPIKTGFRMILFVASLSGPMVANASRSGDGSPPRISTLSKAPLRITDCTRLFSLAYSTFLSYAESYQAILPLYLNAAQSVTAPVQSLIQSDQSAVSQGLDQASETDRQVLCTRRGFCRKSAALWANWLNKRGLRKFEKAETEYHSYVIDRSRGEDSAVIIDGTYMQLLYLLRPGEQDPFQAEIRPLSHLKIVSDLTLVARVEQLGLPQVFVGTRAQLAKIFFDHPELFPWSKYRRFMADIGYDPETDLAEAVPQFLWYVYDFEREILP